MKTFKLIFVLLFCAVVAWLGRSFLIHDYQVLTGPNAHAPVCIAIGSQQCAPATATTYQALARQDAVAAGIDPDLFVRQIQEESGFNPNVVSPAGAIGIAQLMPTTAQGLGVNPHDPVASLKAAAHLMAGYLKQYNGDYAKALSAYNAGSGRTQSAIDQGGTNWQAYIPTETVHYIHTILE